MGALSTSLPFYKVAFDATLPSDVIFKTVWIHLPITSRDFSEINQKRNTDGSSRRTRFRKAIHRFKSQTGRLSGEKENDDLANLS
jgi:hypothetical protein